MPLSVFWFACSDHLEDSRLKMVLVWRTLLLRFWHGATDAIKKTWTIQHSGWIFEGIHQAHGILETYKNQTRFLCRRITCCQGVLNKKKIYVLPCVQPEFGITNFEMIVTVKFASKQKPISRYTLHCFSENKGTSASRHRVFMSITFVAHLIAT